MSEKSILQITLFDPMSSAEDSPVKTYRWLESARAWQANGAAYFGKWLELSRSTNQSIGFGKTCQGY